MAGLWPAVHRIERVTEHRGLGQRRLGAIFSVIGSRDRWLHADPHRTVMGVLWFGDAVGGCGSRHGDVAADIGRVCGRRTFLRIATGLGYAAYSTLVLLAIGRGAASTKYSILSSIGNIPC